MKMRKRLLIAIVAAGIVILLVYLLGQVNVPVSTPLPTTSLVLDEQDRVLVLAPHPDDEVLGCGGVIQQAMAMKLPVHIGFLTYGDFYEWSFIVYKKRLVLTARGVEGMGEVRHDEAIAAAATLGLSPDHLSFFGYPDFGTFDMWRSAWGQSPPVRGHLTRATAVPYANAVRPGAPYKGEEVLKDLTTLIREFRPTRVFVSHPADHHPDHRALYLFTRVCLFDLESELSPELYCYLVHYTDWPAPKGYHADHVLKPPAPLVGQIPWSIDPLDLPQRQAKRAALEEHRSQFETARKYLLSFVRANELFGDFPVVELHAGGAPHSVSGGRASGGQVVGWEEAAFVGVVNETASIENGELVLSLEMSRPLAREVGLSLYLFGYRHDRPFSAMPKLHVKLGLVRHALYDQDRRLDAGQIVVTRTGRRIDVRTPLSLLNDPERILSSVQAAEGAVPLAWSAWRIFDVREGTAAGDRSDTGPDSTSPRPEL